MHRGPADHRGLAAGSGAYVLWGFLTLYWHALGGQPPLELVGQRVVWASLVLGALLTITRRWGALRLVWRDRALLARVVAAAVLLSANWVSYVYAVTHGNVVETALGYFIAPLVTVAIGVIAFGEHLRPATRVALALAAGAVALLTFDAGRVPVIALILAGTWGLYGLIKRVVPLHPVESLAAESLVLLPVAVVVVVALESGPSGIVRRATASTALLVALSGLVTVVPLLLFAFAAPRVAFTILGPLQYFVPVINFLLGVVLYHEPMTPWRVTGFALVWLALVIFTIDSLRRAAGVAASSATAAAA